MCSLFCSLFQAHSAFRCVVIGANARRCSRMQNEIVASKRELSVKTLKHPYSYVPPCYYITLSRCTCTFTLRKGISRLRDSALRYLVIPFTVSAWSGTRSLLRALEAE